MGEFGQWVLPKKEPRTARQSRALASRLKHQRISQFFHAPSLENAKRAGLFIRDAAISASAVLRAADEVCISREDRWQEPMRKPGGSSPESMVLLCR